MKLSGLVVWFVWVMLAVSSCSPETTAATQVMVVVDSDLRSIDAVRVRVDGMSEVKEATASDLDRRPLPRSVAVVYDGGPMGPIVITAEGLAGERVVVKQRARLSFVQGRNVMLRLELAASCVGTNCIGREETCIAGECTSFRIDESDLDDWPGSISLGDRDAGADGDGGMTVAGTGAGAGASGSSGRGGAGSPAAGSGGAGSPAAGSGGAGSPAAGSGGSSPPTCEDCSFDVSASSARGTLSCEAGNVCELRCKAGYTDADGQRSNGCESIASAFGWTPSNFDPTSPSWTPAIAEELRVNCNATVDFGSAALPASIEICGQAIAPMLWAQANGGPEVVVLAARQFSVAGGSKLRFAGSRPVLVAVYGDAEIAGLLDVSAIGTSGGAGSNYACNTGVGGTGENGGTGAGGGGGGGFGTPGAPGAHSVTARLGGVGGGASADAKLRPLRGGCAGGTGGKDEGAVTPGGAGGGALQLTVAGTLRISGTVAAAGGGGGRGAADGDGGGGGGSGGALVLEASRIETLSGSWITANGGGGGAGRHYSTSATLATDGAHDSANAAHGGEGNGAGGYGAAGDAKATAGSTPTCASVSCGAGGGGGGLGRIVLHASDCEISGNTSPSVSCAAPP